MWMKKNSRFKPYFGLGVLAVILLLAVTLSIVQIAKSSPAVPDPGHPWSEIECDTNLCVDTNNSRVGIGTTAPQYKLDVTGDVRWTGTLQGGSIPAARIDSGIIDPARLGSGTPSENTFLRGDSTWAPIPSSSIQTIYSGFPPKPPGYNDYVVPYAVAGTGPTTLTLTASRTYWIPISVNVPTRITQVAINVTTASAGTHYVGIYDANAQYQPYQRIIQWSFDTSSTGVKTSTTGLPLTLQPGVYWIAWAAGSGATVRAIALAASRSLALPGLGTANLNYWYTSGSTLPDPAPTSGYTGVTGGAVPAVGFYYDFSL